jgi:hypothetical protein
MRNQPEVEVSTQLQRKDPRLPVYVVIPGRYVQPWDLSGTTVIEGTANGIPFGLKGQTTGLWNSHLLSVRSQAWVSVTLSRSTFDSQTHQHRKS